MNPTSIPQIKIARYAMMLNISDLNIYYTTPMTISRFNLVPMLSEKYSLLKTVNPDNPNYRNDMSANYRNDVSKCSNCNHLYAVFPPIIKQLFSNICNYLNTSLIFSPDLSFCTHNSPTTHRPQVAHH